MNLLFLSQLHTKTDASPLFNGLYQLVMCTVPATLAQFSRLVCVRVTSHLAYDKRLNIVGILFN